MPTQLKTRLELLRGWSGSPVFITTQADSALMQALIHDAMVAHELLAHMATCAVSGRQPIRIENRWGRLHAVVDSGEGLSRMAAMVPLACKPGSIEDQVVRAWMSVEAPAEPAR